MKLMTRCRIHAWTNFQRAAGDIALTSCAMVLLLAMTGPARAIETKAREAILIDATTGTVLMDKDADVSMPPASMSKIMTAYMVFTRLKEGRLKLDDTLPVSEKAWKMGGSKMFVEVGNEVRVEDLLQGVIVQSGNDASSWPRDWPGPRRRSPRP